MNEAPRSGINDDPVVYASAILMKLNSLLAHTRTATSLPSSW